MSSSHLSRHTLTRLHAGELPCEEEARAAAHLQACAPCAHKRASLVSDAEAFERRIPFARFEVGVRQKLSPPAPTSRRWLAGLVPVLSLAAALLLLLVQPQQAGEGRTRGLNRLKGASAVTLRIAAADGAQRTASPLAPEPLAPGDRVRIGYTAQEAGYVLALSVDAAGEVSLLYPQSGESLPAPGDGVEHYLPDSLEFTGSGPEAVVVVLSPRPLGTQEAQEAARAAWRQAGGDVQRLPPLALEGEQFHRLLLKP
jgi:hypothetical protein